MIGPGKYDDIATKAREMAGIGDTDSGGVIVIVLGGSKGNGFSCQADFETTIKLPPLLESLAKEIREDLLG